MSRVAKKPVSVPNGVDVTLDGNTVTVKGGKGTLSLTVHAGVKITQADNELRFEPDTLADDAQAGTARVLVGNMVTGVTQGFERKLQLVGVGYRAAMAGNVLKLSLGYSHEVNFDVPKGVTITVPKQTEITVEGIDHQLVGQVPANIREWKRPEPYKGKGIR